MQAQPMGLAIPKIPAMARQDTLSMGDVEKTWPRLTWAMCQAGILSVSEASSALLQYYRADGDRRLTGWFGGEAVCHFGGIRAVMAAARRYRHAAIQRQIAAGREPLMTPTRLC